MRPKKLQTNSWICIETVFDAQPWAFATTYDNVYKDNYLKNIGLKKLLKQSLLIFEGDTAKLCNIKLFFDAHIEEIFKKIIKTPSWAERLCDSNEKYLAYLQKAGPDTSNLYDFFSLLQQARVSAWPLAIVDWDKELFSTYLRQKVGNGTFIKLTTNYDQKYEKKVDHRLRRLFRLARRIMALKKLRMEIFQSALEKLNLIWKSRPNLKYTYPWELKNNKLPTNFEIKRRKQFHLFYSTITRRKILSDSAAKNFLKKLHFINEKINLSNDDIIKGSVAYPGKSRGLVKIVNSIKDMSALKAGDILVSHMTDPSLLTALKKCGAIITDIGGITSHAAIIAREMKKPCIIGTKIATKILKNGDLVEVDAINGIVKIIKRNDEKISK